MTYAIAAGFVGLVIGFVAGRFRRSRKTTIIVDKRRRGL